MRKLALLLAAVMTLEMAVPTTAYASGLEGMNTNSSIVLQESEIVKESAIITETESVNETEIVSEEEIDTQTSQEQESEITTEFDTEQESETEIQTEEMAEVLLESTSTATPVTMLTQPTYYKTTKGYPFAATLVIPDGLFQERLQYNPDVSAIRISVDGGATQTLQADEVTYDYTEYNKISAICYFSNISEEQHSLQCEYDIVSHGEKLTVSATAEVSFADLSKMNAYEYEGYRAFYFSITQPLVQELYVSGVVTNNTVTVKKAELLQNGKVISTAEIHDQGKTSEDNSIYSYVKQGDMEMDRHILPTMNGVYATLYFTKFDSANLTEGYYDVKLTTSDGKTTLAKKKLFGTAKPVIWDVNGSLEGIGGVSEELKAVIEGNNRGDYVSLFVYGLNLDESTAPVFYDHEMENPVSSFVTDDPFCAVEQTGKFGAYYTIKKDNRTSANWLPTELQSPSQTEYLDSLYIKFDCDDIILDYLSGAYEGDFLYHNIFMSHDYNAEWHIGDDGNYIRFYLTDDWVKEGDKAGIAFYPAAYMYDISLSGASQKCGAMVKKTTDGRLYIQYEEGTSCYENIRKYDEFEGDYYEGYIVYRNYEGKDEIADISSKDLFEIRDNKYPITNAFPVKAGRSWEVHKASDVGNVIYKGTTTTDSSNVLSTEQINALTNQGVVRLVTFDADGNVISRKNTFLEGMRTYTISYELNGGVLTGENPTTYNKNTKTTTLKNPTKEGYDFAGWYTESNFQNKITAITGSLKRDLNLYAKWKPKEVKIAFDSNGGDGTMDDAMRYYGEAKTKLPKNVFTKTECEFTGWNTTKDGKGTAVAEEQLVSYASILADYGVLSGGTLTLYAQWNMKHYTITYHLGEGGQNAEGNPDLYTIEDSIDFANPITTQEGYLFDGWYTEASYQNRITQIAKGTTGNIELYAKWKAKKVKIAFDSNGGAGTMDEITLRYGEEAVKLPKGVYTKPESEFVGWNIEQDGKGNSLADEQLVSYDILLADYGALEEETITLYAQWDMKHYAIIYHLGGNEDVTNADGNPSFYTIEDEVVFEEPTTKLLGYSFAGWYKENTYKTEITKITEGSQGDIHLYAKWVPYTYAIKFNGNGATGGVMADLTVGFGIDTILSANKYVKTGYAFIGWSKEPGENNSVFFGDKANVSDLVTPVSDSEKSVVLYAVWENEFAIAYDINGGDAASIADAPTGYTYGTATALPKATRAGYNFGGWYDNASFSGKAVSISKTTKGDLELYAKWTPYSYSLVYQKNGGDSGKMGKVKMVYDVEKEAATNNFGKKGFVFKEWNTQANGEGKPYAPGGAVNLLPSKNKGTVNLYAIWEKTPYTIEYETNGGSIAQQSEAYYTEYHYGDVKELIVPVREGYEFAGWYTDATFSSKKKLVSITAKTFGDLVLYAKWQAKYTVVFNSGSENANGSMKNEAMVYGTSKALTNNGFKRTGFVFMGWDTDESADEVVYANKEKLISPNADYFEYLENQKIMNLYAVWRNKFTVTYALESGETLDTSVNEKVDSYTFTDIKPLPTATKDGYKFAGWYTNSTLKTKLAAITARTSGDLTLYPKFSGLAYKITFVADEPEGTTATGKTAVEKMTFGKEKALTKNGYKVKGYTFLGWVDKKNNQTYDNSQKVGNLDTYDEMETLYGTWSKDVYTITYMNMTGFVNPNEEVTTYTVDSSITFAEPSRLGYTFLGWYSDKNCRKKVTGIPTGSTGNKVFYAKWTKN